MLRNFFRLIILGIGATLFYFWLTQKMNWISLFIIFIFIFLFYLATYVTTLEQNKEKGGEDSVPKNLNEYISNSILIRPDSKGRNIFYPRGMFGSGYYLPDSSKQEEIKNFFMFFNGIALVLTSGTLLGFTGNASWFFTILFLPPLVLWQRIKINRFIQGLEEVKIGTENYSPPTIGKRYMRLIVVMLVLGIIGGMGNLYNEGISINNLLMVAIGAAFLISIGYLKLVRK